MSYGMTTTALSRGRSTRIRTILALAIATAALLAMSIGAGSASAAFKATGWTLSASNPQAGSHPAVTVNAAIDPLQGDLNGDDLSQLLIELPAGLNFNPQSVATPCPTASFNTDSCAPATQVGAITVSYRVAGKINTASGAVYSITPDSNSLINFGFVVRPSTSFQKLFFTSGRATGLTTVRQGLDKDYGLNITVPNIPRAIKSTFGTSTAMTISNIAITFNPRSGATQTGGYFVFSPTRCDAANSRVTMSSYAGVSQQFAAGYVPTGCDTVKFNPDFAIRSTNTNAGQSTGIVATVTQDTSDQAVQPSHVKNIRALLPSGTTVNLGVIGATALCSEAQLASDTCPVSSKIGTASVNVPFLPAAMTGEIYLTSRDTIKFAYIIRGARGTIAILRGSAGVDGGVVADFQMLPQVPWSSATLSFTALVVNNPAQSCPSATSWGYFDGYSGAQSIYGAMYPQTNCPPDTTITSGPSGLTNTRTPSFSFASNPAGATSFQCRVDTGSYSACTSPYVLPLQTEGAHTFDVRAMNSAGVGDPTPATRQFTVDATPPAIGITSPAAGAVLTTSTATLNFTTESGATTFCRLDLEATRACSTGLNYTGLIDGDHKIRIYAIDAAGNSSYRDRSFSVLVPKPLGVTINNLTEGQKLVLDELSADFTVTGGAPVSSTVCRLYDTYTDDLIDGQLVQETEDCKVGTAIDLSENHTYRFEVEVTDQVGATAVASARFTSGIKRPTAPRVADPITRGRLTNRTPKFDLVSGDDRWPDAVYECGIALKGSQPAWTPCGNVQNPGSFQVTTPMTDGDWVFSTRAVSGPYAGPARPMSFSVGPWDATYTMTPSTTKAGAHPDLDVNITPTRAGQLKKVDITLPKGLIGSLNSGARCADAGVPTGTCDAASQIGTVSVRYQIAAVLVAVPAPGEVYFTNPQFPGDAAGMVIHVHAPIVQFKDVIIPLRVQLINNSQQMRIFSNTVPTVVADADVSDKFTQFWVNKFDMHVDGSKGSPQPLLTNPSSCTASQFSGIFGDTEGNKTPAATIPFQATDCASLPFNPAITQSFSSTAAGTLSGVSANVSIPTESASFKSLKVIEPGPVGPFYGGFGSPSDQCVADAAPTGNSTFDPSFCPASSLVGSMTIVSPLLDAPLQGKVYLINKSPLPWLGVALDGVGIKVRLVGVTALPQVDLTCDPTTADTGECPQQIAVTFGNLPDLQATNISFSINGADRAGAGGTVIPGKILVVASAGDPTCLPTGDARTTFTPNSGTAAVNALQNFTFSGCAPH